MELKKGGKMQAKTSTSNFDSLFFNLDEPEKVVSRELITLEIDTKSLTSVKMKRELEKLDSLFALKPHEALHGIMAEVREKDCPIVLPRPNLINPHFDFATYPVMLCKGGIATASAWGYLIRDRLVIQDV